ncbi:hypothetical protein NHF40_02070 [Maricaulaceae bacterium EIL42A08]|nr:hypothetical protein [Maricaulaceae bacterium EIL42A08]
MPTIYDIPVSGALSLQVSASEKARRFRLALPNEGEVVDFRLIVFHAERQVAPPIMTVTGTAVESSSQMQTATGMVERVRLKPGAGRTLSLRLGAFDQDRIVLVRRRAAHAAGQGTGLSPIRFPPRRPVQAVVPAPMPERLCELYKADSGAAFAMLSRMAPEDRRDAALALLVSLAENDVAADPADPLLMMLQSR